MPHTKQTVRTRYRSLREWRSKQKLTQRQAAEFLGVAAVTYQKYELGERCPRGENLMSIREKTRVALEALVGAA